VEQRGQKGGRRFESNVSLELSGGENVERRGGGKNGAEQRNKGKREGEEIIRLRGKMNFSRAVCRSVMNLKKELV